MIFLFFSIIQLGLYLTVEKMFGSLYNKAMTIDKKRSIPECDFDVHYLQGQPGTQGIAGPMGPIGPIGQPGPPVSTLQSIPPIASSVHLYLLSLNQKFNKQ